MRAAGSEPPAARHAILAPWTDERELLQLVDALRAEGKRVIWELPGQTGDAAAMQCDAVIRRQGDGWVVDRNN